MHRKERFHPLVLSLVLLSASFAGLPAATSAQTSGGGGGGGGPYNVTEFDGPLVNVSDPNRTLNLSDDTVTSAFDLGFSFTFFDATTSLFWVGSNGFVTLFERTPDGCCEGDPIPNATEPNGLIAGFWTDLDPSSGGEVAFDRQRIDNRSALVVDYAAIPVAGTDQTATFQVIVFEDDSFELRYGPTGGNRTTSVGAEDMFGEIGIELFHGTDLQLDGRAFRFTPTEDTTNETLDLQAVEPDVVLPDTVVNGTGTGFQEGADVFLSGTEVPSIVDSSQKLRFLVPEGFPDGVHDVTVINPDGGNDTLRDALRVLDTTVQIEDVGPSKLRVGDTFFVSGTGFDGDAEVLLDGTPVEMIRGGTGFAQALVPADHPLGLADVTVRDDGEQDTVEDALLVLGRPDATVADLEVERDEVRTDLTPGGIGTPGPWTIHAEFANEGRADLEQVGYTILVRPTEGPLTPVSPSKARVIAEGQVGPLDPGESRTIEASWDDPKAGEHEVLAIIEHPIHLRELDHDDNEARQTAYVGVGGQGGVSASQATGEKIEELSMRVAWEEHHRLNRTDQTDLHENTQVHLDATTDEEDFTFSGFSQVFDTQQDRDDGTAFCTTWRFFDEGTFSVDVEEGNGISGLLDVSRPETSQADGNRTVERWRETVVLGVVLTESEHETEDLGPAEPRTTYEFAEDRSWWRMVARDVTGDFTHCEVDKGTEVDHEFTFAALPDDTTVQEPSFSGDGEARDLEVEFHGGTLHTHREPLLEVPG